MTFNVYPIKLKFRTQHLGIFLNFIANFPSTPKFNQLLVCIFALSLFILQIEILEILEILISFFCCFSSGVSEIQPIFYFHLHQLTIITPTAGSSQSIWSEASRGESGGKTK